MAVGRDDLAVRGHAVGLVGRWRNRCRSGRCGIVIFRVRLRPHADDATALVDEEQVIFAPRIVDDGCQIDLVDLYGGRGARHLCFSAYHGQVRATDAELLAARCARLLPARPFDHQRRLRERPRTPRQLGSSPPWSPTPLCRCPAPAAQPARATQPRSTMTTTRSSTT